MGFFGLGRRSTTPQPQQSRPAAPTGPDKGELVDAALRGSDPAARDAALDLLLKDPAANAARLAIIAVQDADGRVGQRAVAVLDERKQLKSVARKAKAAAVRSAAEARITALDAAASRPSEEKSRATRLAALEELVPRATRLAVGNGVGAQAAWDAIAGERSAILARHPGLSLDEASTAVLARLDQLSSEVAACIAQAKARAEAAAAAPSPPVAEAPAAANPVPDVAIPDGFAAVVARAEQLATVADPEGAVDEFLRLHKEALRLGGALDAQHELNRRFTAAWEGHRQARRQARQDQTHRRERAAAEVVDLVAQAEALAAAADAIAPDDETALGAHRQTLDALRDRFRTASRAMPPPQVRASRERFQAALDDAYAPLRAAREAADAEAFANLVRAEQLKDEVEALPIDTDPAEAFRLLKDCQARWRRLGPMPRGRARAAWDAFRAAGDASFSRLKPWLAAQDQERQAALARREELCIEAEAALARPPVGLPGSPAERDGRRSAAAQMRALQTRWREAGEVPRGMDRTLWERFKKAQDAFWEGYKSDLDAEQERRAAATAECEHLVAGAEAFATAAEKAMAAKNGLITANDVQRKVRELRERARDLPAPEREARVALEKRFDDAIDRILATIRDKLDAERGAQVAAAEKRRALLAELTEILAGENPRWQADAVDRIKHAWRDTGRVPAAEREALDRAFSDALGTWRALGATSSSSSSASSSG